MTNVGNIQRLSKNKYRFKAVFFIIKPDLQLIGMSVEYTSVVHQIKNPLQKTSEHIYIYVYIYINIYVYIYTRVNYDISFVIAFLVN